MSKISIFLIVFSFFILSSPVSYAENISIQREVVEVEESQLIELALEEKFDSFIDIIRRLVEDNIDYSLEEGEGIDIVEFLYTKGNLIRIYYRLN
ncbi:hypothetical protein [Halonatronum saccharophilum]|uniref:hypothetical protein n=1 Tax=Halonatronum saccharophilum TaxID=150060 RepID=UPI00048A3A80|nr:hypothetical protein [Halonatronum saccharophilum]